MTADDATVVVLGVGADDDTSDWCDVVDLDDYRTPAAPTVDQIARDRLTELADLYEADGDHAGAVLCATFAQALGVLP